MTKPWLSQPRLIWCLAGVAIVGGMSVPRAQAPQPVPAAQAGCRVTGRITSVVAAPAGRFGGGGRGRGGPGQPPGGPGRQAGAPQDPAAQGAAPEAPQAPTVSVPIPGATIVVQQGARLVLATSADATGRYSILFTPGQTFHVSVEMTGFAKHERELTLAALPCDTTLDVALQLVPRDQAAVAATPTGGATSAAATGRFTQLTVTTDAVGTAAMEASPVDQSAELARLLPPGFTLQGASAQAVSVNSGNDAINVDRGVLNARMDAIGRGELDPATGEFAAGFGPTISNDDLFAQGRGGLNGGGRGGGGPGGPGGFAIGGRGGRGQAAFQGSVNYSFGGSVLDSTNYQPRNGVITPLNTLPYARNNFGGTFGGPVIIPGLYANTNRRTTFQVNYAGNHATNQQDQYATVPTVAMRNGDFSSSPVQLVDPSTGEPFAGNQIAPGQMSPAALALLAYVPEPNVPGARTQNYHTAATTLSKSNSFNLRITQNLSPAVPQAAGGRAGGAGRGGGGGRGGGPGGPGGRGGRGLSINLTAQVQYRSNEGEQFNVLPQLSGMAKGTNLAVPLNLTVSRGRTNQTVAVNITRSTAETTNSFSRVTDVAGDAGIVYPSPQDPLNWGLPNLTFSNFTVRSSAASSRRDLRMSVSYTLSRPVGRHQLRLGGEFRRDRSTSISNSNARGAFTFTGLYTGDALISTGTGADFADFLLGLPQEATLQVGGSTELRQKTFAVYVEDNWQRSPRMTFNLGFRYEVPFPYVETQARMANLDVTPEFTAASVVTPGDVGPQSATVFSPSMIRSDWNNVGPRVGMAYRLAPGTILNTSYAITYNTSSYASIAQRLVAQPPFADTVTNSGSTEDPLSLQTGLLDAAGVTTNNFGIDPRYGLGMIQTWNATVSKVFWRTWTATAGYTGTRGTSLDLLRAPNRNADGSLRIDGVQPFTWESSGGRSLLTLASVSLQRGMANGLRFSGTYTLARSMDNASSLGAGGAVVAQNDQDLDAEYALSSFDRRHQLTGSATWELPFGVARRWLSDGGTLAALVGEWSMTANVTAESGTPLTVRVVGATSSVANGTSGSLRADYLGGTIALDDPSLTSYFNTGVFAVPASGAFGTSPRNIVTGPGGYMVTAQFARNMRIGGTRTIGLQININNLLNTTRWTSIDTNINSNTFGQVTRFAPMRTITLTTRIGF